MLEPWLKLSLEQADAYAINNLNNKAAHKNNKINMVVDRPLASCLDNKSEYWITSFNLGVSGEIGAPLFYF